MSKAGGRNPFFEDRKLGRTALSVSSEKGFGQDPLYRAIIYNIC